MPSPTTSAKSSPAGYDAGRQPALDAGAPACLRLDNRGPGRIDEHRASHWEVFIHESGPAQRFQHIAFVASQTPEARDACAELAARYGNADPAKADVIVALGGDGLMLQTLHKHMNSGKPIYGMHRGTVGFLMNEFAVDGLIERLTAAQPTVFHPLVMRARDTAGRDHEHRAINEVSLFRQSAQAANLRHPIHGAGTARGTGRRRRAGGDAGRLHGL